MCAHARAFTVLRNGAGTFAVSCVLAKGEFSARRARNPGGAQGSSACLEGGVDYFFSLALGRSGTRGGGGGREEDDEETSTLTLLSLSLFLSFFPLHNATTDRVRVGAEAPQPREAARRLRRGRRPGDGGECFVFSFLFFFSSLSRVFFSPPPSVLLLSFAVSDSPIPRLPHPPKQNKKNPSGSSSAGPTSSR